MTLEVNMSDIENETNSAVEEFIDAVQQKNYNAAQSMFSDLIQDKVNTRLDAEKVAVANSIFNSADDDIDIEEYEEDELDAVAVEDEDDFEEEDTAEDEGKHIYAGGGV